MSFQAIWIYNTVVKWETLTVSTHHPTALPLSAASRVFVAPGHVRVISKVHLLFMKS